MSYRLLCRLALLALLLVSGCRLPVQPLNPPLAAAPTATPIIAAPSAPAITTVAPTPTPASTASAAPSATSAPSETAVAEQGLVLIGALKLNPANRDMHADVAGYKNLAFVGKRQGACLATGVDIIDISDPFAPVRLAGTPPRSGAGMEDMQAIEIGGRDVLAIGLQACGGRGQSGLDLVDISDPRNPRSIGLFATEWGVHEFGLTQTPGGQTLALLALPGLEERTATSSPGSGQGDLLIVDLSDPTQPTLLAEWGVRDEPALGSEFALLAQQGGYPGVFLHSVRANADGTRAYLSYWDGGVIILDINDPAQPRYLGHTTYAPDEEGNAHSIAVTPDDTLLIEAIEDFSARDETLTSSAFSGRRSVVPVPFVTSTQSIQGELVYVGRGCPARSRPDEPDADAYLADPNGKVALIEAGACRIDQLLARVQQAGATGAIVYRGSFELDDAAFYQGATSVELADGTLIDLTLPAVLAPPSLGRALRDADGPVSVEVAPAFTGWGGLRLLDIHDPAHPVLLSTFTTPHATDPNSAQRGPWSAHNPELVGSLLFASWYRDGVRAIDVSDPAHPREVGAWDGADRPGEAAAVEIWGVVAHNDLLLASDMNYGLYVLRYQP